MPPSSPKEQQDRRLPLLVDYGECPDTGYFYFIKEMRAHPDVERKYPTISARWHCAYVRYPRQHPLRKLLADPSLPTDGGLQAFSLLDVPGGVSWADSMVVGFDTGYGQHFKIDREGIVRQVFSLEQVREATLSLARQLHKWEGLSPSCLEMAAAP